MADPALISTERQIFKDLPGSLRIYWDLLGRLIDWAAREIESQVSRWSVSHSGWYEVTEYQMSALSGRR
jgi:hypothetical protein